MAVQGRRVTVSDSAATLVAEGETRGLSVNVKNTDASIAVQLGGSDVTYDAGRTLAAGTNVSMVLNHGNDLYAIADVSSGGCELEVLETDAGPEE